MLGEGSRGAILEQCITKLLLFNIQIIGMSATLGKIHEIGQFLRANIYETDFRAVPLREMAKIGCSIFLINSEGKLDLESERPLSVNFKIIFVNFNFLEESKNGSRWHFFATFARKKCYNFLFDKKKL